MTKQAHPPRPRTGRKDQGARIYDDKEMDTVKGYIETCVGWPRRVQISQIENDTKIAGRTVRACLSDLDGVDFCLAYDEDNNVFVAEWAEEAEGYSNKLRAQIRTMQERVDRREPWERRLPRHQQALL